MIQRLRAIRERAVDRADQAPPDYDDLDERSSVTIEAPPDVLRRGFIVKGVTSMRPVLESLVPPSVRQKMGSPAGKRAAIGTGIGAIIVTIAGIVKALADAGVFKGGP